MRNFWSGGRDVQNLRHFEWLLRRISITLLSLQRSHVGNRPKCWNEHNNNTIGSPYNNRRTIWSCEEGWGKGGGVGKIVKYGGISNDRSSDKKSHRVRFEQALFKQIGPQLLYVLPVIIRGYAVEFDHPSPRSCSPAVTKSWKAEKLIWKHWCDVFGRTNNTHS